MFLFNGLLNHLLHVILLGLQMMNLANDVLLHVGFQSMDDTKPFVFPVWLEKTVDQNHLIDLV